MADALVEGLAGRVEFGPDPGGAKLLVELAAVFGVALGNGQNHRLHGGQPHRERAGVVFDQEADEALVGPQRGAVDANGRLLCARRVGVRQAEAPGLGEIDLIGGDCKLPPDGTPNLDVDLGAVKGGFIGHFFVVDPAPHHGVAHQVLGAAPLLAVIDVLCP